jgi:hypothetical protein
MTTDTELLTRMAKVLAVHNVEPGESFHAEYWEKHRLFLAQKMLDVVVAEGWKSPEEFDMAVLKGMNDKVPVARAEFYADMKREIDKALEQARTDERKAASQLVGRYLRQKVHYEEAVIAETRIMWLEEAILKGERP